MDPVNPDDRIVRNIHDSEYLPFVDDGNADCGQTVLQLDDSNPLGYGFHIFKMAPGARTRFHEHTSAEQFLVIEGDIVDHDGVRYHPGDFVLLKKGTRHSSYSENGCLLAVHLPTVVDYP